ncbi:MAG TPA: OmpA family protein [Enhygromyxa sp.]|nr:OmpA family protein [Enhygromyxa sp.]
MRLLIPSLFGLLALAAVPLAHAGSPPGDDSGGEADGDATLEASLSADGASAESSTRTEAQGRGKWDLRKNEPWIRRWRPESRLAEIGVYGGVFLLNRDHELFEPRLELPQQGWQAMRGLNPDFGVRVGYYQFRFVGFEVEGGAMPSRLDDGSSAVPFTLRGHVVGQLGLWSVTPFLVFGGGMIGVNSKGPLGTDIDPAVHFGGGVKIFVNRWVALRVDLRDVVTHKLGVDNTFISHNFEALLGLSVVLNRRNTPAQQPVAVAEPVDDDRDRDGILNADDECVDVPENLNGYQDTDGCPEQDRDGDGYWDDQDTCPDEAGVDPDGCPIGDSDGDGLLDDVDQCVSEPETDNGFQDEDGCPDELPDDIKRFTGNIKGITFDTNKATIRRDSIPVLDQAVQTLLQYPDVRIEIAGHTDNQGKQEHNMKLSKDRAESVKSYLVGMGVEESRIETVGHGPDVPIDSNDTKTGRANNRRIEFRILGGARAVSGG